MTTQSSNIAEDFDSLFKKLNERNTSESSPSVIKQKDDVVYIADPSPSWKFWSPIKIGNALSLTISLQKDQAIALLLNKYNATSSDTLGTAISSKIKTKFGAVNYLLSNQSDAHYEVDISHTLQKTKMVDRSLVTKQFFTGHTRLDLAQPLSQGNVIMFKGERNLGKTRLAVNTLNLFL